MAKKKIKKKRKAPETVRYEFEVEDWEIYYNFGIRNTSKDSFEEDFWDISSLTLKSRLVSPVIKNAGKANIEIRGRPELDDHWKKPASEHPPVTIGYMEIPRSEDTLCIDCWVPSRAFLLIPAAVSSEKVKHVSILGEKLKWRKGKIFNITISTVREEE